MAHNPNLVFDFFPSAQNIPEMQETLKMINTINAFPANLSENDDVPEFVNTPHLEEDSFAQRASFIQPNTATSKKKKIGCTCKKTFCLKMYCECYSSQRKCGQDCACLSCKNTEEFESEAKEIKNMNKLNKRRKSSLAQKGCNCKKSHCLKRYCECFNSGYGCSSTCKCQGCQNKEAKQALRGLEVEVESFDKRQGQKDLEQMKINEPVFNFENSINDMDKFFT